MGVCVTNVTTVGETERGCVVQVQVQYGVVAERRQSHIARVFGARRACWASSWWKGKTAGRNQGGTWRLLPHSASDFRHYFSRRCNPVQLHCVAFPICLTFSAPIFFMFCQGRMSGYLFSNSVMISGDQRVGQLANAPLFKYLPALKGKVDSSANARRLLGAEGRKNQIDLA